MVKYGFVTLILYIMLNHAGHSMGTSDEALNASAITITNVININDTLSTAIRLEISDEINIEIRRNEEHEETAAKQKDSSPNTCCLVVDPPKCNATHCVIRRRKMCWNICTSEVMVNEAPGFPKERFPKELIPPNWQTQQFPENITITLSDTQSQQPTIYRANSPYPYQNSANRPMVYNGYYPNQAYFQPRPQAYWCPGPYCPFYMMYG